MTGHVVLTIRFFPEAGKWSAICTELGTATSAGTLDKASTAIVDMIRLHLKTLEDLHERERFFRKHGVVCHPGEPTQPPERRFVAVRPGEFVTQITESLSLATAGRANA